MLPFYFLTILFNAVTGYVLAFCEQETREGGFSFSLYSEVFRLALGAASILTGLFKVLSPVTGNIPVIGDLLPALCNLGSGFILVFEYYRNRSEIRSGAAEDIAVFTEKYRKLAGYVCLAAAALHFVFYPVLFL
jgi:hypothetical protein